MSSTYGLFLSKIRDFVIELKHFIVSLRFKKKNNKRKKKTSRGIWNDFEFSLIKRTQANTNNYNKQMGMISDNGISKVSRFRD